MAKIESYQCDVCGKQKGTVNHWWIISIETEGWYKGGESFEGASFLLCEWNDHAKNAGVIHLCGSECVNKRLSQFMEKVGKEANK